MAFQPANSRADDRLHHDAQDGGWEGPKLGLFARRPVGSLRRNWKILEGEVGSEGVSEQGFE